MQFGDENRLPAIAALDDVLGVGPNNWRGRRLTLSHPRLKLKGETRIIRYVSTIKLLLDV